MFTILCSAYFDSALDHQLLCAQMGSMDLILKPQNIPPPGIRNSVPNCILLLDVQNSPIINNSAKNIFGHPFAPLCNLCFIEENPYINFRVKGEIFKIKNHTLQQPWLTSKPPFNLRHPFRYHLLCKALLDFPRAMPLADFITLSTQLPHYFIQIFVQVLNCSVNQSCTHLFMLLDYRPTWSVSCHFSSR